MASLSEIIQLCRLCLVKDHVNISIFDDPENVRQIPLKISSCLPVKISRDDNLPKKICDGCSSKLDLCYDFWTSTAQAEKTLLCMAKEKENQVPEAVIPQPLLLKVEPAESLEETQICEPPVPKPIIVKKEVEPAPTSVENEAEEPAAKRPRRSAAIKAQMQIAPESDDDDAAEGLATTEDVADVEDDIEDPDIPDMNVEIDDVKPGPSGLNQRSADSETKSRNRYSKSIKPKFECEICGLHLKTKGSLTVHKKRHLKQYVAKCEECQMGFVTNQEYSNHMGFKHGPGNHVCNICGRSCYDKAALQGHMARHADDYGSDTNIKCQICDKTFLQTKYLKHHMWRKHENGGQSYVCHLCGKKVNSKRSLRDHTYIHQGIKPLECTECGKSFGLRTTLKLHMRTHTGQRPYECTFCPKRFTQRTPLKVHMRYHTGERPYGCHLCDDRFVSGGLLNSHIRKMHGTNI